MKKNWLIALLVLGFVMVTGGAAAAANAPLAGRIKPGVTYNGPGTWYDSDGDGACLFGAGPDDMTVAMNQTDYEASKACGAHLEVRANGKTIRVRVNNLCPSPCRVGQLDLSKQAFAKLANPQVGEIKVTWKLLSPGIGGMSLRYKGGSSKWWCAIQAVDHRNPVARLEVQTSNGAWKRLPRSDYNYFTSADGAGCGGRIAVTDIYGQRLVSNALPIRPTVKQQTNQQFSQR